MQKTVLITGVSSGIGDASVSAAAPRDIQQVDRRDHRRITSRSRRQEGIGRRPQTVRSADRDRQQDHRP